MKEFINRTIEKKDLETICENKDKVVLFLCAKSGYGKSDLCKEVLKKIEDCPSIKVEIRNRDSFEPGYYLYKIADKVTSPINNIYLKNTYNDNNKLELVKKIPSILCNAVLSNYPNAKEFVEEVLVLKNENNKIKKYLSGYESQEGIMIIKNALNFVMKNERFILNIENIQNIDDISLNALIDILLECSNYTLLLEFTENDEYYVSDLIKIFENKINDCQILQYEIDSLSPDTIKDALDENDEDYKNELIIYLKTWDGNLKKLVDFVKKKKYDISNKSARVKENFYQVAEVKNYLLDLCLILSFNDELEINLANEIGICDYVINELVDFQLIKLNKGCLSSAHDTVYSCILNNEKYNSIYYQSLKKWQKIFLNKLKNNFKLKYFYNSMYFSIQLNDINELTMLINNFKNQLIKCNNPLEYIRDLEKVYYRCKTKSKNNSALDDFLYSLIELYQNIGFYKQAFALTSFITKKDKKLEKISTLLTYQTDNHVSAISKCNKNIENNCTDNDELFYRLVRINANYALNNLEAVKADYNYIKNNKNRFNTFYEYGYFLKAARFTKSFNDSIPDINRSIIFFEKRNAIKQAYSSKLTKSALLAYCGKFNEAKELLEEITKNNDSFLGQQDMLLNNYSNICMTLNDSSTNILDNLNYAKNITLYGFSKLAICNNILAYKNIHQIDDELLINDIENQIKKRTFASTRIIRNCYVNIYSYYKIRNNPLANKYYDKVFEYGEVESHLYKWLSGSKIDINDPNYFLSIPRYPLNYIIEWAIELDSFLMHF